MGIGTASKRIFSPLLQFYEANLVLTDACKKWVGTLILQLYMVAC